MGAAAHVHGPCPRVQAPPHSQEAIAIFYSEMHTFFTFLLSASYTWATSMVATSLFHSPLWVSAAHGGSYGWAASQRTAPGPELRAILALF